MSMGTMCGKARPINCESKVTTRMSIWGIGRVDDWNRTFDYSYVYVVL